MPKKIYKLRSTRDHEFVIATQSQSDLTEEEIEANASAIVDILINHVPAGVYRSVYEKIREYEGDPDLYQKYEVQARSCLVE